jgi:hypothetical protein
MFIFIPILPREREKHQLWMAFLLGKLEMLETNWAQEPSLMSSEHINSVASFVGIKFGRDPDDESIIINSDALKLINNELLNQF